MPYIEGDTVRIKKLKKKGLVSSLLKEGVYRVSIGSIQITCKESELEIAEAAQPTTTKHAPLPHKSGCTIDLHGLTVAEALERLEVRLSQAIISGFEEVEVVHGLGTGKVMQAVHERLGSLSAIKRFLRSESNPGVTRVFL